MFIRYKCGSYHASKLQFNLKHFKNNTHRHTLYACDANCHKTKNSINKKEKKMKKKKKIN